MQIKAYPECQHKTLIELMIDSAKIGARMREYGKGIYLCPDCDNKVALTVPQWTEIIDRLEDATKRGK